jgi:hypothetical protein
MFVYLRTKRMNYTTMTIQQLESYQPLTKQIF